MNIREMDISALGMFLDHTPNTEIINMASDLGSTTQFLTDHCSMRLSSTGGSRGQQISQIVANMQQKPEYSPVFAELEHVSLGMVKLFHETKQQLKQEVTPLVTKLYADVQTEIKNYLLSHGADSLLDHEQSVTDNYTYQTLNWDKYLTNPESVLMGIQKTRPQIQTFDLQYLDSVFGSLAAENETLDLPEATKENMYLQIMNQPVLINQGINPTLADEMLDLFTTAQPYRSLYWTLKDPKTKQTPALTCLKYKELLETYRPLITNMQRVKFDLSEDSLAILHNNIQKVQQLCNYMEYYSYTLRKSFKPAVLMASNLLNGDTAPEFYKTGGTDQDITTHVKAYHLLAGLPIPRLGVGGQFILNRKSKATERMQYEETKLEQNKLDLQRLASQHGFRQAMVKYLNAFPPEQIPAHQTKLQFIAEKLKQVDHIQTTLLAANSNLEDSIYQFLLRSWHADTAVHKLYQMYQDESVVMAEEDNDDRFLAHEDESMSELDTRVACRFMCDALASIYL